MDNEAREIMMNGIYSAKSGDFATARKFLEWALRLNPSNDERVDVLYWLAHSVTDPAEKRNHLEEALAYNPSDARCRRAFAILTGQLKESEIIDPDRIARPVPKTEPSKAAADRFTCPQCGGRMTFAPDGQSLTCEYCESRQGLEKSQSASNGSAADSFLVAMATRKGHLHPTNRQTFYCQGCGVDFLLPPEQITATCPYCGSAYIIKNAQPRELIDPHAILPFLVDENRARTALRDWLERCHLADNPDLKVERGLAIYLPVWSFEMAGQVPWTCLVQVDRDKWMPENNIEIVYHTAVQIPATKRLTKECAAELNEFDLKQAEPFDERYLANWAAETYQVPVGDASLEARRWTYEFEKQQVRDRMLRKYKDLNFNSLGITVESFKLVLLPLWLTHYSTDHERYEVVINGRTGAVRGQRPLNWLEKLVR